MDVKQEQGSSNFLKECIKTEPEIGETKEQNNYPRNQQSKTELDAKFNVFESQMSEQIAHVEIKEEIIDFETPKFEQSSDLLTPKFEESSDFPLKIDHDRVCENEQIFPKTVKEELENTDDGKVTIKQEVSECIIEPKAELLTSDCDLPTLKMENADFPDYYDLGYPSSSKLLKNTSGVILKKKKRYICPICQRSKFLYDLLLIY